MGRPIASLLLVSALAACRAHAPGADRAAQPPSPVPIVRPGVTGTLLRYESFPSRLVASRKVDVWLPPGYDRDTARRYPVLYAHDGQNLFDPATSFGGRDWGLDETLTRLIGEGKVRPVIVVGVWNTPKRYQEYMPRKAVPGGRLDGLKGLPVISACYDL